ncbi:hypothetical protein GJ496_010905 [Pomphorhynchus laevis]|nr:hypothetical protein GJ496_010905 [Pomphorhynchus laevis]
MHPRWPTPLATNNNEETYKDPDELLLLASSEKFVDHEDSSVAVEKQPHVNRSKRKQQKVIPDLEDIGYFILGELGSGTYGDVYLAEHMRSGQRVAVKRSGEVKISTGVPTDVLREASLLRSVRHENILELFDIKIYEKFVYMIIEHCDVDLYSLLKFYSSRSHVPGGLVRSILRQLASGLQCMHSKQMAHRDLKPQNILIKASGLVKIADFGMCRFMDAPTKIYTNEVVTLYYRPPELLLGGTSYGCFIDMWAVGCILAELAQRRILFKAMSEIDMLRTIFRVLPVPSRDSWPLMDKISACYDPYSLVPPSTKRITLQDAVPRLTGCALELLTKLLSVHPINRITAQEMTQHVFVRDVPLFPLDRGLLFS